jgi:hypothetical protein
MARQIRIDEIDDYVSGQIKALVKVAVLYADQRLKQESPVDTGRFRSNWQTQTEEFSGSVSNNLPYAERLAMGWSRQAPAGWIDSVAKDVQTYVDSQANRIGRES